MVYDFEHHVHLGQALERWSAENGHCNCKPELCKHGRLPVTFMLLQPPSWHPDVWTDITRMLTLNGSQHSKGKQMHLCPMQIDLAMRVIEQFSNPDDVVLDPFSGLGTVPMCAVRLGRIGWGVELNHGYYVDSAMYCKGEEEKFQVPTLFDLLDVEQEEGGERGAA